MTISYEYEPSKNIVYSTFEGTITFNELLEYLHAVLQDDRVKKEFIEVTTLEGVKSFSLLYKITGEFRDTWRGYLDKGCLATIIYAPSAVCYGIVRMCKVVIDTVDHKGKASFEVFRKKEEFDSRLAELLEHSN